MTLNQNISARAFVEEDSNAVCMSVRICAIRGLALLAQRRFSRISAATAGGQYSRPLNHVAPTLQNVDINVFAGKLVDILGHSMNATAIRRIARLVHSLRRRRAFVARPCSGTSHVFCPKVVVASSAPRFSRAAFILVASNAIGLVNAITNAHKSVARQGNPAATYAKSRAMLHPHVGKTSPVYEKS